MVFTDVSGDPIIPVFNSQAVKEEWLSCLEYFRTSGLEVEQPVHRNVSGLLYV